MSSYGVTTPYGFPLGFQSPLRGANPAAGSSFSLALDSRWRWRIISAIWTLTTDANVANRYVTLEYEGDDNNPVWVNAAAVLQTAGSAQRYVGSLTRGVAEWNSGTDVLFPINPALLDGGGTLKINISGVQAGDALTLIRFLVERFETGPIVPPGFAGYDRESG